MDYFKLIQINLIFFLILIYIIKKLKIILYKYKLYITISHKTVNKYSMCMCIYISHKILRNNPCEYIVIPCRNIL
jgi:hypothetical protein